MLKNEKRQSVLFRTFGLFFRYFRLLLQKYLSLPASFSKRVFFFGEFSESKGNLFPLSPRLRWQPPKESTTTIHFPSPRFQLLFRGGNWERDFRFAPPPLSTPPLGVGGWVGFWAGEGGDGKKRWRKRNCTAIGWVGEKGCLERNGFVCILLLCKHLFLAVIRRGKFEYKRREENSLFPSMSWQTHKFLRKRWCKSRPKILCARPLF